MNPYDNYSPVLCMPKCTSTHNRIGLCNDGSLFQLLNPPTTASNQTGVVSRSTGCHAVGHPAVGMSYVSPLSSTPFVIEVTAVFGDTVTFDTGDPTSIPAGLVVVPMILGE